MCAYLCICQLARDGLLWAGLTQAALLQAAGPAGLGSCCRSGSGWSTCVLSRTCLLVKAAARKGKQEHKTPPKACAQRWCTVTLPTLHWPERGTWLGPKSQGRDVPFSSNGKSEKGQRAVREGCRLRPVRQLPTHRSALKFLGALGEAMWSHRHVPLT